MREPDGVLVLKVTSDPIFREEGLTRLVMGSLRPEDRQVVIDLHFVDILHSPGLAQLVTIYVALSKRGITFSLRNLNERNRKLLAITQLDRLISTDQP